MDIQKWATQLFTHWQVGQKTKEQRGILVLVSIREQLAKIEIGYGLEGVFTDFYTSRIESEMFVDFANQGLWRQAFLATVESFVEHLKNTRDHTVSMEKRKAAGGTLNYYSGGAGATKRFKFGSKLGSDRIIKGNIRDHFDAQSSPEETFIKYYEFCSWDLSDYTVELFSPLSQMFFRSWQTSSGQRQSEATEIESGEWQILTNDYFGIAIAPPSSPEVLKKQTIYFFEKSAKGWQMDFNTLTRTVRYDMGSNPYVVGVTNPYLALLLDDYNLDSSYRLVPKNTRDGYLGIHYLGNGLYDKKLPGVAIALDETRKAKESNLKTGDHILAINGRAVSSYREVTQFLINEHKKKGDQFRVKVLRDKRRIELTVTAQGLPDRFHLLRRTMKPRTWLGIYFEGTTSFEQKTVSAYSSITHVAPVSPAAKAGLQAGDIIVSMDGAKNIVPRNIVDRIAELSEGEAVNFEVLRNGFKRISVLAEKTTHQGFF